MALLTPSPAPRWRVLSDTELAATPDAKLGGTLGIIVAIAATIAAIKGLMYLLGLAIMGGLNGGGAAAVLRMFALNGTKSAWIQNLNLAVPALMFVWGIVVTAMTSLRARTTPDVASALIVVWLIVAMTLNVLRRSVAATYGLNAFDYVDMAPYILFNIMIAAAFCGYMLEGRRPNLFYRRRVRV